MEQKVGSICWMELATTDLRAAESFYSNLFGWTVEEVPMGPEMTYAMMRLSGRDVGGAYRLMKEQVDAHVPPHWMLYVRVENADTAADRASQLGAKQIVPPADIPNVGRFAVIEDPTGAHIAVFEPGRHRGMVVWGEENAPSWVDLNTRDAEKAAKFYGDWLGWKYDTGKDGYRHIINGSGHEDMIGGIPPEMHAPPGTPSHWMPYFHVADAKKTEVKALGLNGKVIMPATLMPDVGTIGVLTDPQGAVFALYQRVQRT